MKKNYRKKLSNEEWNAVSRLTSSLKLDDSFDVSTDEEGNDCFLDREEDKICSLKDGLAVIYDALAYPLCHEKLTDEQCRLIVDLFQEFDVTDGRAEWLLKPEA